MMDNILIVKPTTIREALRRDDAGSLCKPTAAPRPDGEGPASLATPGVRRDEPIVGLAGFGD